VGRTLGRRFAGEPIVLIAAAAAKCSHWKIAAPTGRCGCTSGVVTGDQLKCHYHGWAYDCSGKCVDVPYLGKERLPKWREELSGARGRLVSFSCFPAMRRTRKAVCRRRSGLHNARTTKPGA